MNIVDRQGRVLPRTAPQVAEFPRPAVAIHRRRLHTQGTAGVHATGTFSGTTTPSNGATKTVTDGVFDAPVTIVST